MTTDPQPTKTPWYKKWWIWAIVAAVIVIGGISNLVNGDSGPQAEPTGTIEPAPVETTPEEPAPDETVTEEPIEDDEPQADDTERAAQLEQAIKDAFGGQEFSDVFAADPTLWYGWITGVRVDGNNAYITLQVSAADPDRDDLGERAANALPTLLPEEATEGLTWIIVEDASGVVIEQSML